eukprot:COSAG01_NODE_240_length_20656_cov_53.398259_6_plen_470_part_00
MFTLGARASWRGTRPAGLAPRPPSRPRASPRRAARPPRPRAPTHPHHVGLRTHRTVATAVGTQSACQSVPKRGHASAHEPPRVPFCTFSRRASMAAGPAALVLLLQVSVRLLPAQGPAHQGPAQGPPTPAPSPIQSAPYFTNFSAGANKDGWSIQVWCSHCSSAPPAPPLLRGGNNKDECTSNGPQYVDFGLPHLGGTGFRINTSRLSAAKSVCKTELPSCSGAHNIWGPRLLYGTFETVARWYPGPQAQVHSATGFIGLDEPTNTASITMGFHGLGFPDPKKPGTGPFKYQHGIYANNSLDLGHNREYTNTTVNMATTFNSYALIWTPTYVTWLFNGQPVRNFTDAAQIPRIPMYQRLHSRSGYCDQIGADGFFAEFQSFRYTPWGGPSPPSPPSPPDPEGNTISRAECDAAGGILGEENTACCPKACGQCGGHLCGKAPGGNMRCCGKEVAHHSPKCSSGAKAPCSA